MIPVVALAYFSSASFVQCDIITFFLFALFRCRFHGVLSVDLINFCPFHIIHFSRCVKTGNKKRASCLATLLQNKLNSDVGVLPLTFKPVNKLICCKTGLMWVVKRQHCYSNCSAAMLQDKFTHFVARFYAPCLQPSVTYSVKPYPVV